MQGLYWNMGSMLILDIKQSKNLDWFAILITINRLCF